MFTLYFGQAGTPPPSPLERDRWPCRQEFSSLDEAYRWTDRNLSGGNHEVLLIQGDDGLLLLKSDIVVDFRHWKSLNVDITAHM